MGKLYVINDTPLFGVSRKQRMLALRREQSGDHLPPSEFPPPPPLPPRENVWPQDDPVRTPVVPGEAREDPRERTARQRWTGWHLPLAYLLGPLTVAFWTRGRARIAWASLGALSAGAAIAGVASWPAFLVSAQGSAAGPIVWLAAVVGVPAVLFATWGRAITAAARRHPTPVPDHLRSARFAFAAGLIVPGFGFHLTGRPKIAGLTFATLGPLVAATLILRHAQWLWESSRWGFAALSPNALEIVLATAAATATTWLLAWLGTAAHSARLVPAARRPARTGALALAMVVALAAFGVLEAERPLAGCLHRVSASLQAQGFRLIPLGLGYATARMDRTAPAYLADVATLNDALGRTAAADAARRKLEERRAAYQAALEAASASYPAVLAQATPPGGVWARIAALGR